MVTGRGVEGMARRRQQRANTRRGQVCAHVGAGGGGNDGVEALTGFARGEADGLGRALQDKAPTGRRGTFAARNAAGGASVVGVLALVGGCGAEELDAGAGDELEGGYGAAGVASVLLERLLGAAGGLDAGFVAGDDAEGGDAVGVAAV